MFCRYGLRNRNAHGAVAIELAILVPVFMAIALGIVEFGRGMMISKMVANAAKDGARMALEECITNSEVSSSVQTLLGSAIGVGPSDITVTITATPAAGNSSPNNEISNCQTGDSITVKVEVPVERVALIRGNWLGGRTVISQKTVRHE